MHLAKRVNGDFKMKPHVVAAILVVVLIASISIWFKLGTTSKESLSGSPLKVGQWVSYGFYYENGDKVVNLSLRSEVSEITSFQGTDVFKIDSIVGDFGSHILVDAEGKPRYCKVVREEITVEAVYDYSKNKMRVESTRHGRVLDTLDVDIPADFGEKWFCYFTGLVPRNEDLHIGWSKQIHAIRARGGHALAFHCVAYGAEVTFPRMEAKVVREETITVPADTFECYVLAVDPLEPTQLDVEFTVWIPKEETKKFMVVQTAWQKTYLKLENYGGFSSNLKLAQSFS